MNAMTSIEATLADSIDADFPNVLPFKQPEDEAEQLADIHRRAEARYRQRAADTRRSVKLGVAALEAGKRDERARHEQAMAFFAEQIAEAKEYGAREVAAAEKLARYNRGAVELLETARRDTAADQRVVSGSRAWLKTAAE